MALQATQMNAMHSFIIINITFKLTYELHSLTFADIKSKVHIHNPNESHHTIQSACHQLQPHLGEKGIKGEVEQPHAQWIIPNPKTKPVSHRIINNK